MTTTFKTRVSKSGTASTTVATVDWSGVTDEQLQSLALKTIVISQQAVYRTAGHVPATDTIIVADMLHVHRPVRVSAITPANIVAKINGMDPAARAAVIAQILWDAERADAESTPPGESSNDDLNNAEPADDDVSML